MSLNDIGFALFLALLLGAILFVAATLRNYLVVQKRLRQEAMRPRYSEDTSIQDLDFRMSTQHRALMDRIDKLGKDLLTDGPQAQQKYQLKLLRAGFFDPNAARNFRLITILSMFFWPAAFATGIRMAEAAPAPMTTASFIFVGLAFGYYLPELVIRFRTSELKNQSRRGLPDLLDLLVVAAEAGLSLEAALARVGDELLKTYPFLGQNIRLLMIEMRVGQSLTEALAGFANRIDIPEVSNFVTTLQQSREYGTSISDTLRIFSDDMRDRRQLYAEEKAMELPVKLIFPLALFMLPCVFIVALLPVWIQVKEYF